MRVRRGRLWGRIALPLAGEKLKLEGIKTMANEISFRVYGDVGGDIMRALDTKPGWEYRGSHGVFCRPCGEELWGYAYAGPDGEYVTLDFTSKTNDFGGRAKSCWIAGLPADIRELVA
jgi:hypothetical protein